MKDGIPHATWGPNRRTLCGRLIPHSPGCMATQIVRSGGPLKSALVSSGIGWLAAMVRPNAKCLNIVGYRQFG